MKEEESHLEKHVQSNDGKVYYWVTHGHHDEKNENEVEPRLIDKWIVHEIGVESSQ